MNLKLKVSKMEIFHNKLRLKIDVEFDEELVRGGVMGEMIWTVVEFVIKFLRNSFCED